MRLSDAALPLLVATALVACTDAHRMQEALQIEVLVEGDPGRWLASVSVYIDQELVGVTDRLGRVRALAHARAGSRLTITHDCPDGHRLVEPSRVLKVHRYTPGMSAKTMRVRLRCIPSSRKAVFVIRAKNGPSVRVGLDGEHVATTNADGIAHFSRTGVPGTEYSIELDATEDPDLLPRRTSHRFLLPDSDHLFVVDQAFRSRGTPIKSRRRRPRIIKIE